MTPAPIGKPISAGDVKVRLRHAADLLRAAEIILTIGPDDGIETVANIVGSLAVSSGIASADAICGTVLGRRGGENHTDAVRLLREAGHDRSATQLGRLLDLKNTTQYSANLITDARAADLLNAAGRLRDTARSVVAGDIR